MQLINNAESRPSDDAAIQSFCGGCHLLPRSQSFGKARWKEEVEQGFRLYAKSGREDLIPTDMVATLAFFQRDAPEELAFETPESAEDTRFEKRQIPVVGQPEMVAISEFAVLDSSPQRIRFATTDLWSGAVSILEKRADENPLNATVMTSVSHPAFVHAVDFDSDGTEELVVADLGKYSPDETLQGSLWLLKADVKEASGYRRYPLKLGLARVSCVRSCDYDADGDIDLVVSDFGMHAVGSIYLLTNQGSSGEGIPQFEWSVLDKRPGAIDTPIVDFDGDGRLDIVTLVSQHYESIDVLFNRGDQGFKSRNIYQAPDPSYGSSSIEVVDFDFDGDLDVLYTNGDTFDDFMAKPYHSIHLIENQGDLSFVHRELASMPGIYRARAGDIDQDGDMDIAAVSLLGSDEIQRQPPGTFEGVMWLEQHRDGSFQRHRLVVDQCDAATCQLFDWDSDGDLDLIVPPASIDWHPSSSITVFFNQTVQSQVPESK